jgi:serine/threonine protein kinase
MDRANIDELFLDGSELPPDESFDGLYESKDQLFVFSRVLTSEMPSIRSPALGGWASDDVRDFRIVGYCLATPRFPAQIGMEFATGRSLRDALLRLDDSGKAIIVVGMVLGMKFIHSRGVIHRDLKLANILIDDRGHPKIGDLGSSRFCDLKLTLTSGVGTPLFLAPEMYENAEYTRAADVHSFSLIVYEGFVEEPVFPATPTLLVLSRKVSQGERPPLPGSMDLTVQEIIRRG